MRIELRNQTHWRTDHLRAFVREAVKRERPGMGKQWSSLRVTFVYNRGAERHKSCSGRAWLNSNSMRICVPSGAIDRTDLAHVLIHELGHTAGLKHRDMDCPVYSRVGNWREIHSWGESLPLEKAVAVKPTTDNKLAHAQAMLRKAISREKRATTLRKKWQRRVKRYQADAALVMLPMAAQAAQ